MLQNSQPVNTNIIILINVSNNSVQMSCINYVTEQDKKEITV